MIVPCDTTVTITANFGGNTYKIAPSSYILGPVPGDGPIAELCVGGLAIAPTGCKQSLLDCPAHHSHVEQQPG